MGALSCGSTKKIVTTQPSKKGATSARASSEYDAFFEAEKYRLKGDKARARSMYRDFVKLYKNNDAALYNLARLEFESFQFVDAEKYISQAVSLSPKNQYYMELYADILSVNKKPKKAVEIYEQLANMNKGNADEYNYKKYRIYAEMNEYDKALQTLNELEESWGVSPEISLQKVDLLLDQKKEKEAIEEIKKLIADEPRNPEYRERLANLYDKTGRTEEAKKIYEELVNDAPNDAKVLMRSSSYYLRNKDTVGFERVVKNIVANPKIDKDVRMGMLIPLIELNNDSAYISREILPLMKSMVADDRADERTAKLYADILYDAKQYAPAAKAYQDYLVLEKSKFSAWFNLMLCYSNLEQLDSLIATADQSFDYFPNNAFTHYFKGTAHYQKKEFEKSIKSLQNAVDLEPEPPLKAQIYSLLGDSYNSQKKYKNADENFDKSLAIQEDAGTLNNYAYYLSLRGEQLDKALKMSKRSLELSPGNKTFLDTYGWVFYKQGKFDKAKEQIEKAIEGEGDADVLEHLGDIYYKLKDTDQAVKYWSQAKAAGGTSEFLEKKIRDKKIYE